MNTGRTVEFLASSGLVSQLSEVEWPLGLPMPVEPNLPRGSRAIEMPNGVHKGIAVDTNGDHYHCIGEPNKYRWTLADY